MAKDDKVTGLSYTTRSDGVKHKVTGLSYTTRSDGVKLYRFAGPKTEAFN